MLFLMIYFGWDFCEFSRLSVAGRVQSRGLKHDFSIRSFCYSTFTYTFYHYYILIDNRTWHFFFFFFCSVLTCAIKLSYKTRFFFYCIILYRSVWKWLIIFYVYVVKNLLQNCDFTFYYTCIPYSKADKIPKICCSTLYKFLRVLSYDCYYLLSVKKKWRRKVLKFQTWRAFVRLVKSVYISKTLHPRKYSHKSGWWQGKFAIYTLHLDGNV